VIGVIALHIGFSGTGGGMLPKLERLDLNLVEDVFLEKIIEMGPPWILSQKQPIWTLLMLKMNKSFVQASFLRNI
jgi:hypothetical protein